MSAVTIKELLEAGVHFGHQTRRWNPRMRSYIYTQRNGIHLIDLEQTLVLLNKAYEFIRGKVIEGEQVYFVYPRVEEAAPNETPNNTEEPIIPEKIISVARSVLTSARNSPISFPSSNKFFSIVNKQSYFSFSKVTNSAL